MKSEIDVAIIGAGAAGIAAARHLQEAGVECLMIEARSRLGGRAWTVAEPFGTSIDLGCGWLHSADRNPWRGIAEAQGRRIDRTEPPWLRPANPFGFSLTDQSDFRTAHGQYEARLDEIAKRDPDVAAVEALDPSCRWNQLIGAVGTYISGSELENVSAQDLARYDDSGVNWRIADGYGSTIVAHGHLVPVVFDCPVRTIDHSGKRLKIHTTKGAIEARQAIVTIPASLIAEQALAFTPALPAKVEAAAGLPLGFADKLFLSLEDADEFEKDSRLFGHTDRVGTGAYHIRPFGRAQIEAFFAGDLARDLEKNGVAAFVDFAIGELTGLLGTAFARRLKPLNAHLWGIDPFARGSYSYAVPGRAGSRAALEEPVDGRLFFAGEACSAGDFSTAHGAFLTGVTAAKQAIAASMACYPKSD